MYSGKRPNVRHCSSFRQQATASHPHCICGYIAGSRRQSAALMLPGVSPHAWSPCLSPRGQSQFATTNQWRSRCPACLLTPGLPDLSPRGQPQLATCRGQPAQWRQRYGREVRHGPPAVGSGQRYGWNSPVCSLSWTRAQRSSAKSRARQSPSAYNTTTSIEVVER